MTPKELSELYNAMANGEVIEVYNENTGWQKTNSGPNLLSNAENYRIKPKPDWINIPPKTKVLVSDNNTNWIKAEFAIYLPLAEEKFITFGFCFGHGYIQEYAASIASWKYCKLAE